MGSGLIRQDLVGGILKHVDLNDVVCLVHESPLQPSFTKRS